MNSKAFRWGARSIAVLTLAMSTGAQAQAPCPEHLSGIISDYTPYNSAAVAPTPTGPYEMRGRWAVHLKEHEGKGDGQVYDRGAAVAPQVLADVARTIAVHDRRTAP